MKTKFLNSPIALLFIALVGLTGCGDKQEYFPNVSPASGASVKFIHSASDAAGVYFYVNDARISSGANPNTTTTFASSFPATNYLALSPGQLSLKSSVPATATTSEVVLSTGTAAVEEGKSYTIALAGVSPNYETVLIDDDLTGVSFDGNSYVRFINLIHNSTNNVNVIATLGANAPVTVVSNIAYKQAVAFQVMTPGDYTIQLKDAVTNAVIASASTANKLLSANRTYTFFARGQIGQTGTKVPTLDRMINQ